MGKLLDAVKRLFGSRPAAEERREVMIKLPPEYTLRRENNDQEVARSPTSVELEQTIQALLEATNGVELVTEEQLLEAAPIKYRFQLSAMGSNGAALPGVRIFAFSTHSDAQAFGWQIVPIITFTTGLMAFGNIHDPLVRPAEG